MLRFPVLSDQYFLFSFFLMPLFLASWSLQAADNASLYRVEILVTDQTKNVREQAFQRGLDEMLVRLSGDTAVMDKLQRPESRRYVQRFSYQPLSEAVINSQDEVLNQRIKIQYNGHFLEQYLRENDLVVWGARRPAVMIWLAVRDGKSEYVLKKDDQSLIKTSLIKALMRRGIPEQWPLYDAEDKKIISAVDIRGGFKAPLVTASKRYSNGSILSGSLNWNGKQWQSSWELMIEGDNKHWRFNHKSYKHLINKAVDHVADAMGAVFAAQDVGDNQQGRVVRVDIEAVDSMGKYNRVENYLTNLSVVEAVNPMQTDGEKTMFEIILRSSEKVFLALIKKDAKLIKLKTIAPTKDVQILGSQGEAIQGDNEVEGLQIQPLPLGDNSKIPVYYYRLVN